MDEAVVVSGRPATAGIEESLPVPALNALAAAVEPVAEDEERLARLSLGLMRLADSLRGGPGEPSAAVESAVRGAELVARGELRAGGRDRLRRLLPSFTYLVALPLVGQGEALRVSRRTAQLLDGRAGG